MIEKMNTHYSFSSEPSVYDEENLTALELAGRTAAKVNEVVDDQNLLRDQTGKALDETTKQMLDYMRETDALLEKYGSETIPQEVTAQIEVYLNTGEFDKAIKLYAGALEARLDVALSAIDADGVTSSGDLEVRDIRVDVLNNKWSSAGRAVREQVLLLLNRLEDISEYVLDDTTFIGVPNISAIDDGGAIFEGFGSSKQYNVSEGEIYLVNAYYGYDIPDVVFVHSDGNVSYAHKSENGYTHNHFDSLIVVPEGGTIMHVNWGANDSEGLDKIEARKVAGYAFKDGRLTKFVENSLKPLEGFVPAYSDYDFGTAFDSLVLKVGDDGEVREASLINANSDYKVITYPVEAGQKIRFTCNANFGNVFYALYKGTSRLQKGITVDYAISANEGTIQNLEVEMVVPLNVESIKIGSYQDGHTFEICTGFSGLKKWSHLKWLCIGDSITEKNDRTDINYHDYIHDKTGINVTNLGVSGSGLMPSDPSIPNYLTKVITNPNKTQDVITIMLSGNDATNASRALGNVEDTSSDTWCGCLNNILNVIENAYADAVVGIITTPPWVNHMPYQNTIFKEMAEKAKEICYRRSVPFLDLFGESNLNPNIAVHRQRYYSKDNGNGVHPNEAGHLILASPICHFLDHIIGMK